MSDDLSLAVSYDDAVAAFNGGNLALADAYCAAALTAGVRSVEILQLLALVKSRRGEAAEAVLLLLEAARLAPERADVLTNMASSLSGLGRHDEALAACDQALGLVPDFGYARYNRAVALRGLGRQEEAAVEFHRTVALLPELAAAHFALGCTLEDLERFEEAEAAYRDNLALVPDSAEAHHHLGRALVRQGRHADCEEPFRTALRLNPGYGAAANNLACALMSLRRWPEAVEVLTESLQIDPNNGEGEYNLSLAYQELGDLEQAIAHGRKAIAQRPERVDAHWNLSLQMIQAGNFTEGWTEYEWRWKLPGVAAISALPLWDGATDPSRRLLIWAEQGHGDSLQFLRYLPLVRQLCPNVVLRVQNALVSLATNSLEGVTVVGYDQPLPEAEMQAPLLSLPLLMATRSEEDLPKTFPYLHPVPAAVARWGERLAAERKFKVGVVWRGSPTFKRDQYRSMPIETLLPLLRVPGAMFYPLCPDFTDAERQAVAGLAVTDLSAELTSFADTAAIVRHLDLVIAVDSAVVHLTGGVGKPIWLMAPFFTDWRWRLDSRHSAWYPTIEIFRQDRSSQWQPVVAEIAARLAVEIEVSCRS